MNLKTYIEGKRNGQEINALERKALEDRFLEEALNGYDNIKGSHSENIAVLQQSILQQKPQTVFPKYFAIAASVALLLGFGAFLALNFDNLFPKKYFIAKNILQKTENNSFQNFDKIKIDTAEFKNLIVKTEKEDFIAPNFDSVTGFDDRDFFESIEKTDHFDAAKEVEKSIVSVDTNSQILIALAENENILNEVAVGYGTQKRKDITPSEKTKKPEPIIGARAYKNYLKKNINYSINADGKSVKGKVTVVFSVDTLGHPTNIRVTKPLCPECDKEAVRLITNGSAWTQSSIEAEVEIIF
ncbi:MAG: energy transducer TonB [Prevotellaceae bacterium]|jgi:hypothetical protein|nr:energy transducer TonB [Prevotellaceae bacterium]